MVAAQHRNNELESLLDEAQRKIGCAAKHRKSAQQQLDAQEQDFEKLGQRLKVPPPFPYPLLPCFVAIPPFCKAPASHAPLQAPCSMGCHSVAGPCGLAANSPFVASSPCSLFSFRHPAAAGSSVSKRYLLLQACALLQQQGFQGNIKVGSRAAETQTLCMSSETMWLMICRLFQSHQLQVFPPFLPAGPPAVMWTWGYRQQPQKAAPLPTPCLTKLPLITLPRWRRMA